MGQRAVAGRVAGIMLGSLVAIASLQSPGEPAAAAGARDEDCLARVAGINLQGITIPELRNAMDRGRVTSRQLVRGYLNRINAYDGRLRSIRTLDSHALRVASKLDRERKQGKTRGPLHGIPVLLKDNVGTTSMPTTAGSIALRGSVPRREAFITDRLERAGAIVLGKTNLSEFAGWMDPDMPPGYSSLGGQVKNAYNFGDPSGSSAGSGVAASMAFSAATVGTETLGSIVSPSNANSDVGIKPTLGLLSRSGILPLAPGFDTPGPMTRNVTDAAVLLGAMTGVDSADEPTKDSKGHVPQGSDYTASLNKNALEGVRLGYFADNELYFGDEDLAVFERALSDLEKQGATLVQVDPLNATLLAGVVEYGAIPNEFKTSLNAYLDEEASRSLRVHNLSEIIAYNREHPKKIKYGQRFLEASDASLGNANSPEAVASRLAARTITRAEIDGSIAAYDVDALIHPANLGAFLAAPAGYPMVIVPSGYTDKGRSPIGLGFIASAWAEPKLISFAYDYEQATHRRVPPTEVNHALVKAACKGAASHSNMTRSRRAAASSSRWVETPSKLERALGGIRLER
jgi:amidase